jgi:hypothetical protein
MPKFLEDWARQYQFAGSARFRWRSNLRNAGREPDFRIVW